jgi:putative tryptophan/tyrosine transport system substrate-binding protein
MNTRMRRRLIVGAGLALCLPRLGIIVAGINPRSAPFIAAFEQRLHELGWIEGTNLSVEFAAGETSDQLEKAAARFVEHHVDVILAAGPELGAQAASHSTQTIPIVIVALNYDPVEKGLAGSLARPGRNITGVYFRNPEVGAKQLELLHAALPAASRVGLLWTKYSADQVPPVESMTARLRLQLEKVELRPPYDIAATFATLKTRRVVAAVALGDPIIYRERKRIAEFAAQGRLAIIGQPSLVEAGGLLGFGPDLNAAMSSGAEYVDKIFRGAVPAAMPIDQPTKFAFIVNLKTAREIGVTIPQPLLLRADEVIQ